MKDNEWKKTGNYMDSTNLFSQFEKNGIDWILKMHRCILSVQIGIYFNWGTYFIIQQILSIQLVGLSIERIKRAILIFLIQISKIKGWVEWNANFLLEFIIHYIY